jgi:hypothetical protein
MDGAIQASLDRSIAIGLPIGTKSPVNRCTTRSESDWLNG